jgi:transposase
LILMGNALGRGMPGPGASLAGLALKAGVNANQLRKWVEMHRKVTIGTTTPKSAEPTESLTVRRDSPPADVSAAASAPVGEIAQRRRN